MRSVVADELWLTERIGEAIRECLEQGFELPVYAAIMASNGACAFSAVAMPRRRNQPPKS